MPDVDTLNGDKLNNNNNNNNRNNNRRLQLGLIIILAIFGCSDGSKSPVKQLKSNGSKYTLLNLTDAQSVLYNRIKSSKYINNPYRHLNLSQLCVGTSFGLSSSRNDYKRLEVTFKNCHYVDGNLEISNFDPYHGVPNFDYGQMDAEYDFSFLDNITEITGYLIVHNTKIKHLRLRNLKIIGGKTVFSSRYSVYIDLNSRMESLQLGNLKEIQNGSIYIRNNPKLCHIDQIHWKDLLYRNSSVSIGKNLDYSNCEKCSKTCCQTDNYAEPAETTCPCWSPNQCQALTKVTCDRRCDNRCYNGGCCHAQCAGGCTGPTQKDCTACRKLRIFETGECVESCPRLHHIDPTTGALTLNPSGMYQHGIICIRKCPDNLFIYQDFCMSKCPNGTYQGEELIINPESGEKGIRRICKPCTREKCPKSCKLFSVNKKELESKRDELENCEILESNLLILEQTYETSSELNPSQTSEITEHDLEVLSSIRTINGFVRIQGNKFITLNFLRNLEVIRPTELVHNHFSFIVSSKSIKTLGLRSLKSIESGDVRLYTESLCLGTEDNLNWTAILQRNNSIIITRSTNQSICEKQGYVCDPACNGCWSTGPSDCQYCKSYKIDDRCIEKCDGNYINNRLTYLHNNETRECKYCHPQCADGCTGPTEYDCLKCGKYEMVDGNNRKKCVETCPSSHYEDKQQRKCLLCDEACYGCYGPENTIGPNGCVNCNMAVVKNDDDFSVLKCISNSSNQECVNDSYWTSVPYGLHTHPMKGKKVCRQCDAECVSCYPNGKCTACRNFLSNRTNNCVNSCMDYEFLNQSTKTCLRCNIECKLGCTGSGLYECNECRAFKLRLHDLDKIINSLAFDSDNNKIYKSQNEKRIDNANRLLQDMANNNNNPLQKSNSDAFYELVASYKNYYARRKDSSVDAEEPVFCTSQCPAQLPHQTFDYFCSSEKPRNNMNDNANVILIVSLILVVCLSILAFLTYVLKKCIKRKKISLLLEKLNEDEEEIEKSLDATSMSQLLVIDANELRQYKQLGKGAFGEVYRGLFVPSGRDEKIEVAIKQLPLSCLDNDELSKLHNEIIHEATVMASVNHKYCLKLIGICIVKPIRIVFKLMEFGSVVQFFEKYKEHVTDKMLLTWSYQIAEGMEYLESKAIVHRDLAARNILVKSFEHIKITDFGLSKILHSNEKYVQAEKNSLLPIKWMAIESIQNRLFDHKSDVWSYGVCLWEIFTFCRKPWEEIKTSSDLLKKLQSGSRLAQPQMVGGDVYMIMIKCWMDDTSFRPTFQDLKIIFKRFAETPSAYLSINNVDSTSKFQTFTEHPKINEDDYKKLPNNVLNTSNMSPDEGMGAESSGSTESDAKADDAKSDSYNQIITFKRPQANVTDLKEGDVASSRPLRFRNLFSYPSRKFFGKNVPKRLNSQTSTGTVSSYLSSSNYSDDLSSPRTPNLLPVDLLTTTSDEQNRPLLGTVRVSSDSSGNGTYSSGESTFSSSMYKMNPNKSRTPRENTNSDYLEPVLSSNIKQNLEYFTEQGATYAMDVSRRHGDTVAPVELLSTSRKFIKLQQSMPLNTHYYNQNSIDYIEEVNSGIET